MPGFVDSVDMDHANMTQVQGEDSPDVPVLTTNLAKTSQDSHSHSLSASAQNHATQDNKNDQVVLVIKETTPLPSTGTNPYLAFLANVRRYWQDCPDLCLQFDNLSYVVNIP